MAESRTSYEVFLKGGEYKRLYDRCVSFARTYTFDTAQAECMAEEAMVVLWERIHAGETVEHVLPFLFAVVKGKAMNYLKHKRSEARIREGVNSLQVRELTMRIDSLEGCDPDSLYVSDIRSILNRTLASLGGTTEAIFRMSRVDGLSSREIAAALHISVKAVEYHITKAIKALRQSLSEYSDR